MLRFACLRTSNIRPLKFNSNLFARKRRQTNFIKEAETALPEIPGYSTGAKLTAGCSAIGLGALVYNGFNLSNSKDRALDRVVVWPQYVRSRIASSYNYLFQGLVVTGLSVFSVLRSPRAMALATRGGWASFFITIACMIGLQIGTRAIPYEAEGLNLAKHGMWAAHAAFMGFVIAPLIAMYGDVVAQAALYTGGITAGISAIGWTAPSNEYLKMWGPVAMMSGCIFIAAMASPFFNPVSPAGGALYSLVLWGGLCLSGFGMFMSTQRMIASAEHHPAPSHWGQTRAFDPINASLGVYVDMIMMFQRLLIILGNNRRK